jgi:hypothetical protein
LQEHEHDGTRAGLIAAAVEYLAGAGPEVANAVVLWDGELIVVDADMARATVAQ